MGLILLLAAQGLGLLLIPFGLPGIWLQVAALGVYGWATGFTTVGWPSLVAVVLLAGAAEVLEFVLSGRFARAYGGGRRAAWGAILGGVAGALLGLPIPIVGSVVGAFVGSFVGAALGELSARRQVGPALRAGWGALLGRLAATALKAGIGVAIASVALFAALR